jgi:hypothetical protein
VRRASHASSTFLLGSCASSRSPAYSSTAIAGHDADGDARAGCAQLPTARERSTTARAQTVAHALPKERGRHDEREHGLAIRPGSSGAFGVAGQLGAHNCRLGRLLQPPPGDHWLTQTFLAPGRACTIRRW